MRQASHTAVARGKGQLLLPRLEVLANAGVVACDRQKHVLLVTHTPSRLCLSSCVFGEEEAGVVREL